MSVRDIIYKMDCCEYGHSQQQQQRESSNNGGSVLSRDGILREIQSGRVVIKPFCVDNLSSSSYDVTLGQYYYRESKPGLNSSDVFDIYSESDVNRVWGPLHKAAAVADAAEQVIWLEPGETILCHTNEFIGGTTDITTMMKARSSMGRCFIEVCKCAGWGDVGYVNRWTMEVTNNSRYYKIPLVVGRRIAQIVFFRTSDAVPAESSYENEVDSKYQSVSHGDIKALMNAWKPSDMLPKLWKDI